MAAPITRPETPPALPRTTIRYHISRGDLLLWQLYSLSRQRVLIGLVLVAFTYVACLDLREPNIVAKPLAFKIAFVVVFDLLALGFVFLVFLIVGLTSVFRRNRGILGEHLLEITPEGLIERTDVNESLARWIGFHKIKETRRYLFLYVTETQVHMVPKRCFSSPIEARSFLDEIRKHAPTTR